MAERTLPRAHDRSESFYLAFAVLVAVVAFIGFTPTYLYPVVLQQFDGPPILHLHGLLLFAWTLLFVVQARAARTAITTHRALGLVGISLATAMVFASGIVIVSGLVSSQDRGHAGSASALSIVPIFAIGAFSLFFTLAIASRSAPEKHKRYMVLATVALLPPAIARMFFVTFAPEAAGARPSFSAAVPDVELALRVLMGPALIADLLLLMPIVHDWRTRGRPHSVYVVGGGCLVLAHMLRPLIATTEIWRSFTDALMRLG